MTFCHNASQSLDWIRSQTGAEAIIEAKLKFARTRAVIFLLHPPPKNSFWIWPKLIDSQIQFISIHFTDSKGLTLEIGFFAMLWALSPPGMNPTISGRSLGKLPDIVLSSHHWRKSYLRHSWSVSWASSLAWLDMIRYDWIALFHCLAIGIQLFKFTKAFDSALSFAREFGKSHMISHDALLQESPKLFAKAPRKRSFCPRWKSPDISWMVV